MPRLADDDYIRKFAEMVKAELTPGLNVIVEYSNEVWNGQFAQRRYAGKTGMEPGFADKPWKAGWAYYAHRSVKVFQIWKKVFGDDERIVRVLASQAGTPYVAGRILGFQEAHAQADALAIAPAFPCIFPRPKLMKPQNSA